VERELTTGTRRIWLVAACGLALVAVSVAQERSKESIPATVSGFEIPLGDERVAFFVEGDPSVNGPLVISLHRNESTAFPIVRELLAARPGRFIGIRTPGDRRLNLKGGSRAFSIDPNRIFSRAGIEADLRKFSFFKEEIAHGIETFASEYVKQAGLAPGRVVIAVHNNTDGGYSLDSYLKGGAEEAAAAEVHRVEAIDPDDFVLVTHPRHFAALKEAGFNVILQDNAGAPDDGSLSVYCGKQGIDYFNVEAEFGNRDEQARMLRAAFALAAGEALAPAKLPVARPIESGAVPITPRPTGGDRVPPGDGVETPEAPAGKPLKRPGIRLLSPKRPDL
jgi:hypothetical protein